MALTDKLSAIGDAIREKTGGTDLLTLDQMPIEISNIQGGGTVEELTITSNGTYTPPTGIDGYAPVVVNVPQDGSPPESAFTITGNCYYRFGYNGWNWFIENYGNKINTMDVDKTSGMFQGSTELEYIPFDINYCIKSGNKYHQTGSMFVECRKLKNVPKLNNLRPEQFNEMFNLCNNLREIPENYADCIDWTYLDSLSTSYNGNMSMIFNSCYSLRKFPMDLLKHGNPVATAGYTIYYYLFNKCYSLDEVIGLPFPHKTNYTSNLFQYTFQECDRLMNMTFETQEDGSPYVINWSKQTIDLSKVGYPSTNMLNLHRCTNYNSGIISKKYVHDATTYEALKNDPDWYSTSTNFSRYNKASALRTINSLPDTSAFLASNGGTNTIKFKGVSGSATDGGAINTLTEEEIAVATAKGWTVSFV